jgi:hypothetical protein
MSTDLYLQSRPDPAGEAHNPAMPEPGRVEGTEAPVDLTATHRRAWHAPQLTQIEIKRTMNASGPGSDSNFPSFVA